MWRHDMYSVVAVEAFPREMGLRSSSRRTRCKFAADSTQSCCRCPTFDPFRGALRFQSQRAPHQQQRRLLSPVGPRAQHVPRGAHPQRRTLAETQSD